ncbi:hypothetical protein EDC04DRAFT_2905656 [Pisolithus marmoratus]|nr:hypothetical protein EDC04DRAFT_2905656 [Pisolithus marmoratus]
MPPLLTNVALFGQFPTVQSVAEHAIGCLLVAEHSYFLMQYGQHTWKEVLSLAVEEYKISNIQNIVSNAVETVFHNYTGDMDALCEAIINVIIENRMSNKLLMKPGDK